MQAEPGQLLCVLGPTAAGKTDLSIELARQVAGELVSVDSALVYRGMDIGTAKPDYPHHLVDIRDPGEPYSAASFLDDLRPLLPAICARGHLPVLVGGTMLYFKAFMQGLAAMPGADASVRATIAAQAASEGWPAVHAELAAVDPPSAQQIHPHHSQRLTRALEVYRVSGVPLSAWHGQPAEALADAYRVVQVAVCPADRAVLHQRIERRLDAMLERGFVDEVARLRKRGDLHPALPALRSVGYRQIWQYLDGECSLEEARQRALAATRQLAKRQLTWLRKWPDLLWLYTDEDGAVVRLRSPAGGESAVQGCASLSDLVLNYLTYNPM